MSTSFRRITAAVVMTGAAVCVVPVVAGASPAAPSGCPLIALGGGGLKVDTGCLTSGLGAATTPTTAAVPTPTIPVVQTPTTLHLGNDLGDWSVRVEADDQATPSTVPAAARRAAESTTGATGSTGAAGATGAGASATTPGGAAGSGAAGAAGTAGATPNSARSTAAGSPIDLTGAAPTPADAAPSAMAAETPAATAAALDATPVSNDDSGRPWVTWSLVAVAMALAGGLVWRNHQGRIRSDVDSPARWYERAIFS